MLLTKHIKKTLCIICIFAIGLYMFAEGGVNPPNDNSSNAKIDENITAETTENTDNPADDESPEKMAEETDYERKLETLHYGLVEEIIALVEKLKLEEDTRFNNELKAIFEFESDPKIRVAIIDFFSHQKITILKQDVLTILKDYYDYDVETVRACIDYCTKLEIYESTSTIREMIEENNTDYKDACIIALGKIGKASDADFLVECFENEDNANSKVALIIRQNIMTALMELHADSTWDFLLGIAEDVDENTIIRSRAVTALGKIGRPEAVQILTKLYKDKDPILREAVVAGLTTFSTPQAERILIAAFRDSYYKVRLQAIQTARENKNPKAIPYILYRAKTDPEDVVKYSAIDALAETKDPKGTDWLKETFNNEKTPEVIRIRIAAALMEHNFDVIYDDVKRTVVTAMQKKQTLRFAQNIGKNISKIKNANSVELAELYLMHKEPMVQSIGLDMFHTNMYPELLPTIESLAGNEKESAIQRRAKVLLELTQPVPQTPTETDPSEQETNLDKEFK